MMSLTFSINTQTWDDEIIYMFNSSLVVSQTITSTLAYDELMVVRIIYLLEISTEMHNADTF